MPIIGIIPTILLAESRRVPPWPVAIFSWFNPFLDRHPFWKLGFVGWPVILIAVAYAMACLRDYLVSKDNPDAKEIALLLRVLGTPVAKKRARFGKVAKRVMKQTPPPGAGEIFHEITQPSEQILLLVEAVHMYFSNDHEGDLLKVSLARMDKDRIVAWEAFAPPDAAPATTPENLQSKDATLSRAAKDKEMIIISDIAKELKNGRGKKYVSGEVASRNEGSMICFPISDDELRTVPFVLNIKSSKKNHFTSAMRKRYSFIFHRFSERIAMENRLQIIKTATTQP